MTSIQNRGLKKLKIYSTTFTNVNSNSTYTLTLQPPKGKLWRITYAYFNAPAVPSSTTGTHYVVIRPDVTEYHAPYTASAYDKMIDFRTAPITYSSIYPADISAYTNILLHEVGSYDLPLHVDYTNNTDATQTGTCVLRIIIEEEDEAV